MVTRRHCIMVLGMHRSGTSALTGCLEILGAELGTSLLQSNDTNARGHFEYLPFLQINKEIFKRLDFRWDDARTLPDGWLQRRDITELIPLIKEHIRRDFGSSAFFALKDPRFCHTFPLFERAMKEENITVIPVTIRRRRADVARSLQLRNGMRLTHALQLIERYKEQLQRNLINREVHALSYEALIEDPVAVLTSLIDSLPCTIPFHPSLRENELLTFVSEELRHNAIDEDVFLSKIAHEIAEDQQTRLHVAKIVRSVRLRIHWKPDGISKIEQHERRIIARLESDLERMRRSLSWRITLPLRVVHGGLRNGFRKKALPEKISVPHAAALPLPVEQHTVPSRLQRIRTRDHTPDIIIPTHNNADHSLRCIRSIAECTENFRIIWVDNGSDPDQSEQVRQALHGLPHIAFIHPQRLGFVRATNMGMAASSSEFIVLLNNDTQVTPGWLPALLAPFDFDTSVGICGPVTDAPGSWQSGVKRGEGYEHAKRMVSFFCAVIRRDVIRDIGYLSEEFGDGIGDDNEYCMRARRAGWQIAVARDAFVSHARQTTFGVLYKHEELRRKVVHARSVLQNDSH